MLSKAQFTRAILPCVFALRFMKLHYEVAGPMRRSETSECVPISRTQTKLYT